MFFKGKQNLLIEMADLCFCVPYSFVTSLKPLKVRIIYCRDFPYFLIYSLIFWFLICCFLYNTIQRSFNVIFHNMLTLFFRFIFFKCKLHVTWRNLRICTALSHLYSLISIFLCDLRYTSFTSKLSILSMNHSLAFSFSSNVDIFVIQSFIRLCSLFFKESFVFCFFFWTWSWMSFYITNNNKPISTNCILK